MNAEVFVDTNVFLYSIDDEPSSAAKRELARNLLLSQRWGWSVQVAAEFFANATSPKRNFKLPSADASAFLETWFAFPTQPVSADLVRAAIDIHQRFQLSYWDAAIVAAAKQLGCRTLYSEDLNHGQDYDGVRVLNPFLSISTPSASG
jgi:predicted nucleic acid-binding protein